MSDAELIYNALLRAERKVEAELEAMPPSQQKVSIGHWERLKTINLIRQEIGAGLASRPPSPVIPYKVTVR